MDIKEFIATHNVDYSMNPISEKDIPIIEVALGVSTGTQLRQYIVEYGYIGYGFIELYGINNRQGLNSNMVKKTKYLHKYFAKTSNYIALEDQGDGDYYLVDENDMIYRFLSSTNELTCQNIQLFDYILERFSIIKE